MISACVQTHNLIFLTGANMAGKSTFLRSVSVAMYVAHMGFPVAAEENGIFGYGWHLYHH